MALKNDGNREGTVGIMKNQMLEMKNTGDNESKITIVIPVYNAEKYLIRCLDSVIEQTYHNIEILLIDDGSVDASGRICDTYQQNDRRIRVFHQPNSGVSVARNSGLDHATGEYVMFVDSDDWIAPNLCETLVHAMDERCDLVISGYWWVMKKIRREIKPVSAVRITGKQFGKSFDKVYQRCAFHPPWAKVFRRSAIGACRFEPGRKIGEDLLFNLNYMENCPGDLVILPYCGYYYNTSNSASASHQFREDDFEQKNYFYHRMLEFREIFNMSPEDSMDIERQFYLDGIYYLQLLYEAGFSRDYEKRMADHVINHDEFAYCASLEYGYRFYNRIKQQLCIRKCEVLLRAYFRIRKYVKQLFGL